MVIVYEENNHDEKWEKQQKLHAAHQTGAPLPQPPIAELQLIKKPESLTECLLLIKIKGEKEWTSPLSSCHTLSL